MSDPLFPFGFGLSYTNFSIGAADFSKTEIRNNETIVLTVPVTNLGKRDGTEIVQVYIHKVNDSDGPLRTLKGFQRLSIAAGKTGQAIISLPYDSFEFYDRPKGRMTVLPGEYEIYYGNSSDPNDLKTEKIRILK
jgi:beta-glucosidase